MNHIINCPPDCPNRKLRCHSTCKQYAEQKAQNEEFKESVRLQNLWYNYNERKKNALAASYAKHKKQTAGMVVKGGN